MLTTPNNKNYPFLKMSKILMVMKINLSGELIDRIKSKKTG